MTLKDSKKVLVLTGNHRIEEIIHEAISSNDLTELKIGSPLDSLKTLIPGLQESEGPSLIRKELLRIVQHEGYPFLIMTDMRIDSGLENDNDRLKIFRTILISFILFSVTETLKNISCNLIIFADHNDFLRLEKLRETPELILSLIKTNDEKINKIVHQLKHDRERFLKTFSIAVFDSDADNFRTKFEINMHINKTKIRERFKKKHTEEKHKVSSNNKKAEAADVLFKKNGVLYKNGSNLNESATEEFKSIEEGEIYISGVFTGYTRLDVIDRITQLINNKTIDALKFVREDPIIFNIPSSSTVDSTTAVTLVQLFIKELSDFKKIRIKTAAAIHEILQQTQGFKLLEKYLTRYS